MPGNGKMVRRGRPMKLTDEVMNQICLIARSGAFVETSAAYVGVSGKTLREWIKRGRMEIHRRESGVPHPPERSGEEIANDEMCAELVMRMDQALSECEVSALAMVGKAAQLGDWRAAAYLLERRWPDRWGKKQIEISGKGGGPIEVVSWADAVKKAIQESGKDVSEDKEIVDVEVS